MSNRQLASVCRSGLWWVAQHDGAFPGAARCQLAMIVVHSAGCYKTVRCEYRLRHHKTDSTVIISMPSLWWASMEACLLSVSFQWLQGYGRSHPPTASQTVAGSARQCQAQSISASTPTMAPRPSAERQLMFVMLLRHAVAPQLTALQTRGCQTVLPSVQLLVCLLV